jgi:hypothetical protein
VTAWKVEDLPAPAVVPVTPPSVEVLPGGVTVGGPATAPRATPEGTSVELSKIEGKAALAAAGGAGVGDLIKDLVDKVREALASAYGPGSYVLVPVCDVKPDGTPADPITASWPGGSGQLSEVSAKLDAMAVLLQGLKDLRQPICKGPRTEGRGVTVHFVET